MKIGFFGNKRRKSLKNKHMKFTSNLSQRDPSTSWIGPQSGYIPAGFVHFVDWSAMRIHPNGILPLRGYVPTGIFFQQKSLAFLQGFAPQPGLEPGTP